MKKISTFFARGVVYLVGLAALAGCLILLPELARENLVDHPSSVALTYSFLGGGYILAIPFFVALYQTHHLLHLIDQNKAFSQQAIKALANIKHCAMVFSVMVVIAVVAGISVIRSVDPTEDITFLIPLGFILTFLSSIIAIFVAVLQKLLQDAVTMKSENDLIV